MAAHPTKGGPMNDATPPKNLGKPKVAVASLLAASFLWLGILASGVAVLATTAILVGAATPFRYVGF